ncbi:hypothetical protein [Burkholderia multivorans]|uniref:hypothetical protein n=1 Tax=Burkholderia multivorans TaxID=87883 RepID=UPI0019D15A82|nr:hypothetical protein [Burkholderia multivorans]MBN6728746.1 hypothetical protein [Burkholderia multivorans]
MIERPILFSGQMVRAILEGRKTQTRRIAKDVVAAHVVTGEALRDLDSAGPRVRCPHGARGDRLWVRETWQGPLIEDHERDAYLESRTDFHTPKYCEYAADGGAAPKFVTFDDELVQRWRPSIHMPRWASRITLEITSVRVERLQSISEPDARAEGVTIEERHMHGYCAGAYRPPSIRAFHDLWDSLNAARGHGWDVNPWVWVVEFRRIEK